MERGVICYKPTHTKRNKKEIQINFRSVKSRSMEDWNVMKLSRGGLMADSAGGQQGITHPAEPQRRSILRNVRFNRRHEDDVGGLDTRGQTDIEWPVCSFPKYMNALGFTFQIKTKNQGSSKKRNELGRVGAAPCGHQLHIARPWTLWHSGWLWAALHLEIVNNFQLPRE